VIESATRPFAIGPFIAAMVAWCPAIRAIWCIGDFADTPPSGTRGLWDLLAFANPHTLLQLRLATTLHRQDVCLRVVTDGDRVHSAWGNAPEDGSLARWEWAESGAGDAFYSEARWAEPQLSGVVERVRLRALCLWREDAPRHRA